MKKGVICCTEETMMESESERMDKKVKFRQCGDKDVEGDGCDCDRWN
jgi:hypothetical protein